MCQNNQVVKPTSGDEYSTGSSNCPCLPHPISTCLIPPHSLGFSLAVTSSRKPSLALEVSEVPCHTLPQHPACRLCSVHFNSKNLFKVFLKSFQNLQKGCEHQRSLITYLGVLTGKATGPWHQTHFLHPDSLNLKRLLFIFQRPATGPSTQQCACFFLLLCLHLLIYVANDLKSNTSVHEGVIFKGSQPVKENIFGQRNVCP